MKKARAAIYTVGVIGIWMFCAAASLIPPQAVLGAMQRRRWGDLLIALIFQAVILAIAYGYPLLVAGPYEKIADKRAWFRPPGWPVP